MRKADPLDAMVCVAHEWPGLSGVLPQIHVHLEPQNGTLCGNSVSADVTA